MSRALCILHANCQGDPLADLLRSHPQFGREYQVRQFVNYVREPIPDRDLAACALFLHQHLDGKWGDLASSRLKERLSPGCRTVCLPNLYCKQYWPCIDANPVMDYSDSLLNLFFDKGLNKREILHLYTRTDLTRYMDLEAVFAESWDREYAKEERWDVKVTDLVREFYRKERLFNTVNHPGRRLTLHVAQGILALLGFSPLSAEACRAMPDPFPEFELPIHPQVARMQGLPFATADTRYTLYGRPGTFLDYVSHYIDCRALGISDFISYLRVMAGEGED